MLDNKYSYAKYCSALKSLRIDYSQITNNYGVVIKKQKGVISK